MKFGLTSVILGSSPCLKKVTARNYYEAVSFIEIYSKVFKILANYINGKIVFWIKPRTTLSHRVVVWSIAQLCPVLCDPMDCSPQGSSVHGILQARILDGLPFLPPGDLPDSGVEPMSPASPALAGRFFITDPPGRPIYIPLYIMYTYPRYCEE